MNIKPFFLPFIFLTNVHCLMAQTAIHDATITGPATDPHSSAVLDVKSTDKGLLVPNLDIANLATAAPVTGPAIGLLVYNTNTTTGAGYYYWNGSSWVRLMSGNTTPLTGTGATNKVAFWTNNTDLFQDNLFHWDNTNKRLGIGATTPANGIHVRNADPTPLYLERTSAANVNIRFTNTSGTLYAGMNPSQGFAIGPAQDLGNATTWMTLTSAGNMGVGNTVPRALLNVGESVPTGHQDVYFRSYGDQPPSWKGGGAFGYTSASVIIGQLNSVAQIGGHGADLQSWANLAINSGGGNVSIGNTSFLQRLHVNGDINVNTGQGFRIDNTATSGQYLRGDGTRFTSSAIQLGDLPSSGQITVGTTGVGLGVTGSPVALGGTVTISSNATAANTASTIVARDASGNFTAGQVNANLNGQWLRIDDRVIEPNSITSGHARFGFTSYNNNNTAPYADFLHLRSYTDASGGSDNLIMLSKSGIAMRVWQQTWNSASPYSTYKTVAFVEDIGNFSGLANPSATIGLTAVNGSATTAMRSDGAPALSQAIVPTWTGTHTFSNGTYSALFTGGNVGVGTPTPSAPLDVNGVIRLRGGGPAQGYVLTATDANGNATWEKEGQGQSNSESVTAGNWYRIASNAGNRANALFTLRDFISGGGHSTMQFRAGTSYNFANGTSFTMLNHNIYSTPTFTKVRILQATTYDPQYLEVYVARSGSVNYSVTDNLQTGGWIPVDWTVTGSVPAGYTAREFEVNNLFTVGDSDDRFTVLRGGNVGIGHTAPTYNLHVNGRIGTNAINETSDARLKTNVTDLTDALSKVLAMRGVNYRWRTGEFPEMKLDSTLQFGLIAQELESIVPELVHTDSEGWKSIEYSHIVPLLIEAMKEQQFIIDAERNEKSALKAEVEELRRDHSTRIATLEAALKQMESRILISQKEVKASADQH